MAKDLTLAILFDLYGGLFSPRQQEIFNGYYNEDLSLSELAEAYGITRQGALQTIQTVERKLKETERRLGLYAGFAQNRDWARQIEALAVPHAQSGSADAAEIARLARRIAES